jgi:uncharacterized heparinase superfamily protein
LTTVGRYFHTVRHLRAVQVAARVRRKLHKSRPKLGAAPPLRRRPGDYVAPIAPEPSLVGDASFSLLNVERRCALAADWEPADASALWIYHLHYFDDLNARGAADRASAHSALLERWVAENPPGAGTGWQPYPVSRRIVNWIKAEMRSYRLPALCAASLAVQARWLSGRLEFHLLGNHLLANAKALVYAGLFFEGREASSWAERGLEIVERELREQVLPDGGHFELSPMYQALVLEDLLDLVNLLRAYARAVPQDWLAAVARMRHWLDTLTHPDGGIAFFNDAALGAAPSREDLDAYARRLGLAAVRSSGRALELLEPSGYARARGGSATLLCDCAEIGPDHLPGHAHADTLSFELSIDTQRVLVNSGVSEYGTSGERERQRGTAAHNTVVIDGCDSSEVWAGFRVARRARLRSRSAREVGEALVIDAAYDGYRRPFRRNAHRRRWTLTAELLEIEDEVTGVREQAEAWFHVHPAITTRADGTDRIALEWAGWAAVLTFERAAGVDLRAGTWHPQFGKTVPNAAIVVRFAATSLVTRLAWERRQ